MSAIQAAAVKFLLGTGKWTGILLYAACAEILSAQAQDVPLPHPNAAQLAWQQAEFGVLISYDLHVFDGQAYNQRNNRITPVQDYTIFNPEHLDTDQWIRAVRDAGARFAILTATHETGFALFQSRVNPYCLKALDWKGGRGDIVRYFVDSCRKYGIKPGIYLGIRWNSYLGVHNFTVTGEGRFRENRQRYYNRMVEGMVKEICTGYGDLFEIWFDGGADHPDNGAPDVLPVVREFQPGCLFYHNLQLAEARWGGSESGTVPYPCWATFPNPYSHGGDTPQEHIALLKRGDPEGPYWMPAMSDAPLRGGNGRHEWFWEPGDEEAVYPLEQLIDMYYGSVGRNSTLILGLTPNPDGLLPPEDVRRLQEFGQEIRRRFATPLATVSGSGSDILLDPGRAVQFNHLVIQEDIAVGERVRAYRIEALTGDGWQDIAAGTCIGQKRIQVVDPVEASQVRLILTRSVAEPRIKRFSIYYINDKG